jgi:hypothetical protein
MKIKGNTCIQLISKNITSKGIFKNTIDTKFLSNFALINQNRLQKYNFSSKLYSAENLKFQKTFKFTKNSEKIKEISSRQKYQDNIKIIKELEEQIKEQERLMYTSPGQKGVLSGSGMMVMRKDKDQDQDQDQNDDMDFEKEELKPVNIVHKNKRKEFIDKRNSLINENEGIKLKYLITGTTNRKFKSEDQYEYIRNSQIKDVFSYGFSFGNKLLNSETYESTNKSEDEKPWSVIKEEEEINTKQTNLENEISSVLDEMINKEMQNFDVNQTPIPHRLGEKPLLRTVPVDLNQPPSLLVEGDLNVNYDLGLEYERLLRLSNNDDFGQKIKEDQDKEEEREEIQEEEKDFLNEGDQPNTLSIDRSITMFSK